MGIKIISLRLCRFDNLYHCMLDLLHFRVCLECDWLTYRLGIKFNTVIFMNVASTLLHYII